VFIYFLQQVVVSFDVVLMLLRVRGRVSEAFPNLRMRKAPWCVVMTYIDDSDNAYALPRYLNKDSGNVCCELELQVVTQPVEF